jgi:DNA-binding NarL/FixJ family response regulator
MDQPADRALSIVICDDHPIVGQALCTQLAGELGAEVQLGASFFQAHALAAALPSLDLWILDINLPGEELPRNIAQARALHPGAAIIIFSGSEDPAQLRMAAASGIDAFVPKSTAPDLLVAVLRRVLAGEKYFPDMAWLVSDRLAASGPAVPCGRDSGAVRLTDRQLAVLRHLAEGQSNKEIGRALAISPMTVKVHLAQIFGVLGVANRTEAVVTASRLGLIP